VPGDVLDQGPVQRGDRRVVGLQGAERGEVDPHDGAVAQAPAQVLRKRLDLGQLGHRSSIAHGSEDRLPRSTGSLDPRGDDGDVPHAARPLPQTGSVFLDPRGRDRALRVSWHSEADLVVLSLWRDNVCTGSFRVAAEDVPALVDVLRAGLEGSYRQAPAHAPPEHDGTSVSDATTESA
jgi:hypothetical protein